MRSSTDFSPIHHAFGILGHTAYLVCQQWLPLRSTLQMAWLLTLRFSPPDPLRCLKSSRIAEFIPFSESYNFDSNLICPAFKPNYFETISSYPMIAHSKFLSCYVSHFNTETMVHFFSYANGLWARLLLRTSARKVIASTYRITETTPFPELFMHYSFQLCNGLIPLVCRFPFA